MKTVLIGKFDEDVRSLFDQNLLVEFTSGKEAEVFLANNSARLLVVKNQLDDGLAMGFLFKWLCMGHKIIRKHTRIILMDFDVPLPTEYQWEKVSVFGFKDSNNKIESIKNILNEIESDRKNTSDVETAIYFMSKLEMVKAKVIRANETLINGISKL
jgi:hypothetical protein